ncbi:hypothetical protein Q4I28_003496, partial [Leishmania naiffi]
NFVVQALIGVVTNPMEFKRVEDRLRPALVGCQFAAKIEGKMKAKRPHSQLHQVREEPRTVPCRAYHDAEPRVAYDKACLLTRPAAMPAGERPMSASARHFRHFPYELPQFVAVPCSVIGRSASGILYGSPSAARRYMQQQLQRQVPSQ